MVEYKENDDIFKSTAQALVNPVNCAGIMGKGLALEFKKRFPYCFKDYKKACKTGELRPGILLCTKGFNDSGQMGPVIILFPTKNHWRGKSQLQWIDDGLKYLKEHHADWGLASIAMSQLGCGLGGLRWDDVRQLIEGHFSNKPDIHIEVFTTATKQYNETSVTSDYRF